MLQRVKELSSPAFNERLSTGAEADHLFCHLPVVHLEVWDFEVEQLHITGDRLHYRRITGTGPEDSIPQVPQK